MNIHMNQHTQRQQGGTFLGLIIGLVLGLGAALAVAVYVTKVPVPFVNKGNTRNVEQDEVEAKKNKDWDPNGMIQGKLGVRSASGTVTDNSTEKDPQLARPAGGTPKPEPRSEPMPDAKPGSHVEPRPEPKAQNTPDGKGDAKTTVKIESKPDAKSDTRATPPADPIGDLARAKTMASPAEPFTYMVQTGAFRGPDEAEAQRVRLMLAGVDVKVSEREQSGRTVYRVRSGPYERREEAEKLKDKLETAGYEAVLVRIQR